MTEYLVDIDWYALPHCPENQLQKGKYPTDTGYDLRSAETIEVPTYKDLEARGLYSFEEISKIEALTQEELDLISSNPSIKIEDSVVYRKKYKVPLVKTGVVLKCRNIAWTAIVARSGTPKLGVIIPNALGVIDYEYYKITEDSADELRIQLISLVEPTVVFRGERLAQLIPQHYVKNQLNHSNDKDLFSGKPRGGFNSSGNF
jgi:dUTPase